MPPKCQVSEVRCILEKAGLKNKNPKYNDSRIVLLEGHEGVKMDGLEHQETASAFFYKKMWYFSMSDRGSKLQARYTFLSQPFTPRLSLLTPWEKKETSPWKAGSMTSYRRRALRVRKERRWRKRLFRPKNRWKQRQPRTLNQLPWLRPWPKPNAPVSRHHGMRKDGYAAFSISSKQFRVTTWEPADGYGP